MPVKFNLFALFVLTLTLSFSKNFAYVVSNNDAGLEDILNSYENDILGQDKDDAKNERSVKIYNPDEYLKTPEIIRRHGYPAESHVIQTEDGYLLTMHRIPHGRNQPRGGQPVFLQHGLLSSSVDWVDTGNRSLAFILADNGYDVWLGNARGNTYSTAHVSLSTDSVEFWDFSFHEMGMKDLPAAFDYVSSVTGQKGNIIYIGHSMGTTMFFILASTEPRLPAEHVKAMIALAPVTYMTDIKSPIKYLTRFVDELEWMRKHFGFKELSSNSMIMKIFKTECTLAKLSEEMCEQVIFSLVGFDEGQCDMDMLPVILAHIPAGASTKTIIHYSQEIRNAGNFQMYDYGTENSEKYGTLEPPKYNLTNVRVPVYLMYAYNDWLAGIKDVKRLAKELRNVIGIYEVPLKTFNHIDFLWAKDVVKLVYTPMLKTMKRYS